MLFNISVIVGYRLFKLLIFSAEFYQCSASHNTYIFIANTRYYINIKEISVSIFEEFDNCWLLMNNCYILRKHRIHNI